MLHSLGERSCEPGTSQPRSLQQAGGGGASASAQVRCLHSFPLSGVGMCVPL